MKVSVTQDDIDNGVQMNAQKCAVARAINRAFDGRYIAVVVLYNCDIYPDFAAYEAGYPLCTLRLPMEASEFIILFDESRNSCEPIDFDVDTTTLALAA